MDGIEIEIQFQDIYARFAKKSQVAVFCMFLDERAHVVFFHCAFPCHTRHLEFCGAREISVSSPEPEAVTKSTGTGVDGFSAWAFCTSVFTRSISVLFVGPRLEPLLAVASYPEPALDGRE